QPSNAGKRSVARGLIGRAPPRWRPSQPAVSPATTLFRERAARHTPITGFRWIIPAAPCCCQARIPARFWSDLGRDFWFSCEPPPCEGTTEGTPQVFRVRPLRILLRPRLAHRLPVSSLRRVSGVCRCL